MVAGLQLIVRVRRAPGPRLFSPLSLIILNLAASGPARPIPSTVRGASPLLVRVRVWGALAGWRPKTRLSALRASRGAVPMPASETSCGLAPASLGITKAALRLPVAVGEERTFKRLISPGWRGR